jgi:hypothetical protein
MSDFRFLISSIRVALLLQTSAICKCSANGYTIRLQVTAFQAFTMQP